MKFCSLTITFLVTKAEGIRCNASPSPPNAPDNILTAELLVAILSILPTPHSSIFSRCSKYPIYSQQIGSFGFKNKYGVQQLSVVKGSRCSWVVELILVPLNARARPAFRTLRAIRTPFFKVGSLSFSIGTHKYGGLKRELTRQFEEFKARHCRRQDNKLADRMAKFCMEHEDQQICNSVATFFNQVPNYCVETYLDECISETTRFDSVEYV
ncbi:hypothetical protein BVRB_3g051980 [Beta vulgaris subsp. vulgaris]|nr:hypothetical protein BVRB_3g051980 [Beta vulgaris subsp. vulgaris]